MCTLSLFRTALGYRVFMNRDERHDRADELPPQILRGDGGVFGPVDPVSGGTWIAYNARGFWGCLLNGYFEDDGQGGGMRKSRGRILPEILGQDNPLAAAAALEAAGFSSFRLVVGNAAEHRLYVWDGEAYGAQDFHDSYGEHSYFLSSSSWNQDAVIDIRTGLFKRWVEGNIEEFATEDRVPDFHISQEPELESAPLMRRSYSRTKSITALNAQEDGVRMSYWKVPEDFADIGRVLPVQF